MPQPHLGSWHRHLFKISAGRIALRNEPVGVASAIAISVVRRRVGASGGRAPGKGPRCVWVGATATGAGAPVVVNHSRRTAAATRIHAAGRRGWRKLENRGRRRDRAVTRRDAVSRRGHAQRRAPGRRVICGRGRRTGTRWRLMLMRVRERVYVTQVPTDDGPRLVGHLSAGRPPTRLMVIRHCGGGGGARWLL